MSLKNVFVLKLLPPPQAFPRLSGDWGTREHARSAREGWWEPALSASGEWWEGKGEREEPPSSPLSLIINSNIPQWSRATGDEAVKAPIPVSRRFSSGLLGKLRLQEGSDADTASSSCARFSHTGESEGLVMKHKGPWEGDWARIPIGKGKGKFAHPSGSWGPNSLFPFQRLPRRQRRGRVWQNLSLLRDDMTHPWPDSRCLEVNYSRDFGIIRTKSQRPEAMRIFCLIIDYSYQKKIRSLPPRPKVTSKIISCRDNTLIPWGSIINALNYHAFAELKTGLRPRYALVTKTK